jgi:RNA polymerase sigma-70 factor, ECF subfamily
MDERASRPDPHASRSDALERLYDAHGAAMYRYALMVLADPGAAEDAVQQVFVKLAARRDLSGDVRDPGGYLRTAVRNACYDILRRREAQRPPAEAGPILEPARDALAEEDERREVEQALRGLPPDQRETVHMKVYEQMTFRQIAEACGVSVSTAAGRYRLAMEKLRVRLARHAPRQE